MAQSAVDCRAFNCRPLASGRIQAVLVIDLTTSWVVTYLEARDVAHGFTSSCHWNCCPCCSWESSHRCFALNMHRISAFAGTDLAVILRVNDIDTFGSLSRARIERSICIDGIFRYSERRSSGGMSGQSRCLTDANAYSYSKTRSKCNRNWLCIVVPHFPGNQAAAFLGNIR